MHSGGLELTKLTYGRHEDNLLYHRGDRVYYYASTMGVPRKHHGSNVSAFTTWQHVGYIALPTDLLIT